MVKVRSIIVKRQSKESLKSSQTRRWFRQKTICYGWRSITKIFKEFAGELSKPVKNVINSSIIQGIWPDIYKLEIVTPVPKVFPPKEIDQLRNISGLLNLDKVAEKLISKLMISDMKLKMDPSQYANQKGLSINHYLFKFIDRIMEALDTGESCAVLATLVDWKQAFPRQCPKLGVESFIKNGVRPALIPLLINYFQGRKMKVKWHGKYSSERDLNGPQGSTFGIWEYLSHSVWTKMTDSSLSMI